MATLRHLFNPRPYQINLLRAFDEGKKRLIHIWHRRCGKDLTDLNIMIGAMAEKVGNYYYFLPTYSQAKKVIWEGKTKEGIPFLDFFPKQLIDGKPNDSELKIKFKNGSLFQLIGTDNIDSIVGTNPIGCVFSEFPLQDPKAWDFIRPILAENGGWAIFNGTPRGRNHAWTLLNIGRESGWFTEVLTVDDTNAIPESVIEDEKRQMPQELFEQEYYCKFIDGAGQFFRRIRENTYDKDRYLPMEGDFQIGIDLAKSKDWTVITPFNLNLFVAYPQDRFNQIDWNLQKSRIEVAALKYNDALLNPDCSGLGDPIVDDLKARGLRIKDGTGFKFTQTSRKQLLDNLAIKLEQDQIRIPNDEGLIAELEAFRYQLNDRGKLTLEVPAGMTDDRVMSLALAVWDTVQFKRDPFFEDRVLQNRQKNNTFR